MCTVSWTRHDRGYDLLFNRDELNTRAPEQPPEEFAVTGVRVVAPRDGAHGGTWLLTNEFGITVGLLNDYAAPWRPPSGTAHFSRGHVVLACAAAKAHDEVHPIVQALPLARTLPFQLVVLAPEEGPLVLHWQGRALARSTAGNPTPPLSSSSFATLAVMETRIRRFRTAVTPTRPGPAELAAYHRQHANDAGAHSVLMRRPDAATRSISHVTVDGSRVCFDYTPVQWSAPGPVLLAPTRIALPRRRSMPLCPRPKRWKLPSTCRGIPSLNPMSAASEQNSDSAAEQTDKGV